MKASNLIKTTVVWGLVVLGGAAATANAAPPEMPALFDKPTVQTLIAKIEEGQNATILQFGYFLRRNPEAIPVQQGFALLQSATEAEPMASKRWFILQAMQGFAGVHAGAESREAGFKAYRSLFDNAEQAEKVGANQVVLRATREYVTILPTEFGIGAGINGKVALISALNAHLKYLANNPNTPYKFRWNKALNVTYNGTDAMPRVQQYLNGTQKLKSYALLRVAADIYEERQPDEAIALLKQAKSLLPKDKEIDVKEMRSLYSLLVDLLTSSDKIAEAVTIQQEFVELTHQGSGRLAILYHTHENPTAAEPLVTRLATQGNDAEVNETALVLLVLRREYPKATKAAPDGIRLLKIYLSYPRTRPIEQELLARLRLGEYLFKNNQLDDAKVVLNVKYSQPLTTPAAKLYYANIQQLSTKLQNIAPKPKDTINREN